VRQVMPATPPPTSPLSIAALLDTFTAIAAAAGSGSRRRRIALLADAFRRTTPLEAKYLAKIVIGEMRHGVQEGILLDAIAALGNVGAAEVRRAHQAVADIGRLSAIAKTEGAAGLARLAVQLFRPLKPMLAQTAADVAEAFTALHGR